MAFFLLSSIAGLALFVFTRLFGLVFLGSPRSPSSLEAREPEPLLRGMLLLLAVVCLGISLGGPWVIASLEPLLSSFALRLGLPPPLGPRDLTLGIEVLHWYTPCAACCYSFSSARSLCSANARSRSMVLPAAPRGTAAIACLRPACNTAAARSR